MSAYQRVAKMSVGGVAVRSSSSGRALLAVAVALFAPGGLTAFGDEVSGVVLEAGSLVPLSDALVSQQAVGLRTRTAADGTFTLRTTGSFDLVIVAAKKGYFHGSVIVDAPTGPIEISLDRVPEMNDPKYALASPEFCEMCHPDQAQQWYSMPMGNAGINTWVHDMYSGLGTPGGMGGFVYQRDSVHAASNPNAQCAACHQPEGWIVEPFTALADPTAPPTPASVHGVLCDVCHKIADVDESKLHFPGIYPGVVKHTRPTRPWFPQVQYGVLGDVSFWEYDLMRPSYQPQLVAEVCAVCHQYRNDPAGDQTFTGVLVQSTYSEWASSPYGVVDSPEYKSCVTCHMPPYGSTQVCGFIDYPRDSDTIRSHDIRGTTPVYLEMAVDLHMTTQRTGNDIEVEVRIANTQTGHHVPTGAIMRNMILLVEAWRPQDGLTLAHTGAQMVHMLGGMGDPAQGYYAGLAGKLYAKVLHNADGMAPTFCTEATGIAFDNRIPATQSDTTNYTFSVPGGGGPVQVRARLIYRRAYRPLTDMKQWEEDGHGNPLADLQPPDYGQLMESAEHTIELLAGDFDGDGDADLDDYAAFISCATGPGGGPVETGCSAKDFDADDDVDVLDFAAFQRAFTGTPH